MTRNHYVAIWLKDEYAREFLGLPKLTTSSRWVAVGELQDEESAIGFWFSVDRIEEQKTDNKRVIYSVNPNICVIRWDGIITIQRVTKGAQPEIGIRP